MAITLQESAKLSTNILQKGVIEVFLKNSAVLETLPFMEVVGNAYTYNQVKALPEVAFREVNAGYTESGSTFDLKSERLYMLGGEVHIDRFIAETRGNVNDIRALETELKAKSIAETFTKTFFKGNTSERNVEFDGLDRRLESSQKLTATELTLDSLNELMDKVPNGADVLFMSRKMRRDVMAILQKSGHYIEMGQDAFGKPVAHYGGVAIRVIENGLIDEDCIYAVKMGAMTDVCGIQNGGVRVFDLGQLETKPVLATRIEWFVSIVVFNPLSVAKLTVSPALAKAKK